MLRENDLKAIKSYGYFCMLTPCLINNVLLCERDFGNLVDIDPKNADEYGCGNM